MSRGAKERDDTWYVYMTVPTGERRKHRLRKMGVAEEDLPEKSVVVVLCGKCTKWRRKHARKMMMQGPKNYRARFQVLNHEDQSYRPFTREDAPR